jgi:hypothetical protein
MGFPQNRLVEPVLVILMIAFVSCEYLEPKRNFPAKGLMLYLLLIKYK